MQNRMRQGGWSTAFKNRHGLIPADTAVASLQTAAKKQQEGDK
jgi:hypothetical protein